MTEPPELPELPPVHDDGQWHPLPPRGALFAAAGGAIGTGIFFAVIGGVLALLLQLPDLVLSSLGGALGGALFGALLGAWFGWRRHRLTFWRLDSQALGVRRGHLWQSESHVPISRVQHLDLGRGPLQRAAGLATLTVHTAGTRLNTVAITGLELADAERLRDRLARQLDHDDDAL